MTPDEALPALVRAHDWARTPLGPMETWPATLRGYLQLILLQPTPAILFWGPDLLQLYNAGYAAIMGPRHPQYLGAPYRECWPDTYPTVHPWMQRVLKGEVLQVERSLFTLTRHGFTEEAYFTFSFVPLLDDGGKVAGIYQPVVEVTAVVLADRRRETLRALAPEGGQPLAVAEILSREPRDVSFSLLYLASGGLRYAEGSGLPGAAPQGIPAAVARAFETNAPVLIEDVPGLLGAPHDSIWGDETRAALALPVRRSSAERARGVVVLGLSPRLAFDGTYRAFLEAVSREIAAHLAAEEEQRARRAADTERENLHRFFMQTPAPLCILRGPDHVFALANRSYLDLVRADVVGKRLTDLFPAAVVAPFRRLLDDVYQRGEPFVGRELPFGRAEADGSVTRLLINVSYTPLRGADGNVEGVLAFVYDITPEVAARTRIESLAGELRTALGARDEFLGIASHELKTPLTSLKLQLQLAQRREPETARALSVDKLLSQADRLGRLVDDMLDISRINAGRLQINPAQVELGQIAREVLDRFAPQLAASGAALHAELQPGVYGTWDAFRIEQVLTNLLTNAMKYAPGRALEVSARSDGAVAKLIVRDEGPGIAPADRERIFGRFERASSPNVSGLGLGLYISREIVKAHGGRIYADGDARGGAIFVVELPASSPSA